MNSHKGVRITMKKINKSLRMWAGKYKKMCYIILEHPLIICLRIALYNNYLLSKHSFVRAQNEAHETRILEM